MSDQNKKTPYLAETDTHKSGETVKPSRVAKGKKHEIILKDNDFLEPTGNVLMWSGLLLIPIVIFLLALAQGFFSENDVVEEAVVVEETIAPAVVAPREKRKERYLRERNVR